MTQTSDYAKYDRLPKQFRDCYTIVSPLWSLGEPKKKLNLCSILSCRCSLLLSGAEFPYWHSTFIGITKISDSSYVSQWASWVFYPFFRMAALPSTADRIAHKCRPSWYSIRILADTYGRSGRRWKAAPPCGRRDKTLSWRIETRRKSQKFSLFLWMCYVNMGIRHCSAINCTCNSKWNKDLTFFRFPKDPKRWDNGLLSSPWTA